MSDIKTTGRDFALFKAACEEWLDELSLREWRVFYEHGEADSFKWATLSNRRLQNIWRWA